MNCEMVVYDPNFAYEQFGMPEDLRSQLPYIVKFYRNPDLLKIYLSRNSNLTYEKLEVVFLIFFFGDIENNQIIFRNIDLDEFKNLYRDLVQTLHPDSNTGNNTVSQALNSVKGRFFIQDNKNFSEQDITPEEINQVAELFFKEMVGITIYEFLYLVKMYQVNKDLFDSLYKEVLERISVNHNNESNNPIPLMNIVRAFAILNEENRIDQLSVAKFFNLFAQIEILNINFLDLAREFLSKGQASVNRAPSQLADYFEQCIKDLESSVEPSSSSHTSNGRVDTDEYRRRNLLDVYKATGIPQINSFSGLLIHIAQLTPR